ncbi:MAG: UvrB/UvrC motif-containing protein [Limisphaerales bacterium]|jgi:protein arginine kinase activator
MICQMCNKAEATVHLTQVVGGKSKKLDLCANCAEQCGVDDPAGFSMIEILKKFSGVFGQEEEPPPRITEKSSSIRCPVCGYSEQDMSKTGRVGCPSCYITFERELEKALKSMHRGTRHVGKQPEHIPLEPEPLLPEEPVQEVVPEKKPAVRKQARATAQKKKPTSKEAAETEVAEAAPVETLAKEELSLMRNLVKSKEGMLEEAIEVENYEYAAKIRDEIKDLKEKIEKLSLSAKKEK